MKEDENKAIDPTEAQATAKATAPAPASTAKKTQDAAATPTKKTAAGKKSSKTAVAKKTGKKTASKTAAKKAMTKKSTTQQAKSDQAAEQTMTTDESATQQASDAADAKKTAKKAAKKTASKKSTAKKTTAKKTAAKKTAAKKTAQAPQKRLSKPRVAPAPAPEPAPAPQKIDPSLADNWKQKPVEDLVDAEIAAMPEDEYMNDTQMAFFRLKLTRLRDNILEQADRTTSRLREDTVVVPDPADRATIEEEHALELRTRDRERKLLKKIDQSIARIDAGDYGYCDETGEPIGIPRLLARPTATLSLEAQERREHRQKMFGD